VSVNVAITQTPGGLQPFSWDVVVVESEKAKDIFGKAPRITLAL
jgi:hypothetical protein